MDQSSPMTVTFRCSPELEAVLPSVVPAVQGLPPWFKALPQKAFSAADNTDLMTVKKCPPFIDAMAYGFLIPLAADLKVQDGEFSWDFDVPGRGIAKFSQSPIDFHPPAQVEGTPFADDDRFIIKFNNFWTIETPPGYSLLFTHPLNRIDLPFTTISGLVDTDLYVDNLIHFPARWHDANFNGVLPKGTPVAQCIPIKRASWGMRSEPLSNEAAERLNEMNRTIVGETGVYRRQFRARKR
jgi:hypothetical protein